MILKRPEETMLDAIERTAREASVAPRFVGDEQASASLVFLFELVGALATEVKRLHPKHCQRPPVTAAMLPSSEEKP